MTKEEELKKKIAIGKELAKLASYQRDKWIPLLVNYLEPSIKSCGVCGAKFELHVSKGKIPREGACLTQPYMQVVISCSNGCWMPNIAKRYFSFDMEKHKMGIIRQIKEWNSRILTKGNFND